MKRLVLLELPPQEQSVYFVVEYDDGAPRTDTEREYFFEEKLCPHDALQLLRQVVIADDQDPHGLFEYVAVKDVPPEGKLPISAFSDIIPLPSSLP